MNPLQLLISAITLNSLWSGTITNTIDLSNGLCYGPSLRDITTQTCIIGKVFELNDGKGYVLVDDSIATRQKKGDKFYCTPLLCPTMPVKSTNTTASVRYIQTNGGW